MHTNWLETNGSLVSRSTVVLLIVRDGADSNGRLYIRYKGAAPKKQSRGVQKSLQTTSLSYSNAKYTLKVLLAFNKVEKT